MSRYLIAEAKIDTFIRAAMDYGKNADVASVVVLNRAVGKARAELLEMFDDRYESEEEEEDRWKEKLVDKICELAPSVVERVVADASQCQKAAADIRNCLQPLTTGRDGLVALTTSGDLPLGWIQQDVDLLNVGIARLKEIADGLDGKKP